MTQIYVISWTFYNTISILGRWNHWIFLLICFLFSHMSSTLHTRTHASSVGMLQISCFIWSVTSFHIYSRIHIPYSNPKHPNIYIYLPFVVVENEREQQHYRLDFSRGEIWALWDCNYTNGISLKAFANWARCCISCDSTYMLPIFCLTFWYVHGRLEIWFVQLLLCSSVSSFLTFFHKVEHSAVI